MHTQPHSIPQIQRRLQTIVITRVIMQHWLLIFILAFGLFNLLPFLAPAAMQVGWTPVGDAIYTLYSTLCHQMAQRSFFMFGPADPPFHMHNIDELPIQTTGNPATDMFLLREFQGNAIVGWKVAWSDRMVYMYGALWLGGVWYWLAARQRPRRRIPIWLFVVLLLPMVLDGGTHMFSDLAGLAEGFRYHNTWLANLTGSALPDRFYIGDAFGSFNSWMRLLSGLLFGFACAWLVLPLLDAAMRDNIQHLQAKEAQGRRLLSEREQPFG